MLIAYDGGAFQHGNSAGILDCSVGFLNAAAELDPTFEIVLVADPRLGPIRSELLDRLTIAPEIVYAELAPGADPPRAGLLSGDPDIRFEVDGNMVAARQDGGWVYYDGPPPRHSFVIASRSARPCDVSQSTDLRILGVAISRIVIDDHENPPRVIAHDEPELIDGFGGPEANWRWTTGRAAIPLGFFPDPGRVQVGIELHAVDHHYRIGGSFDRAFNRLQLQLQQRSRRLLVSKLAAELAARGAQIYFANHLIPVVVPGLKLVSWAYNVPNVSEANSRLEFQCNIEVFQQAGYVFSISERTRQQLVTGLRIPAERVIATGVDLTGDHAPCPPATVQRVRQKYGIGGDYVLCVGTIEPRRNHLRLVQAYHRLIQLHPAPPQLVIVSRSGSANHPLLNEIDERGLHGRVQILGETDGEELAALYSDAMFVVYPSLYEGFRLPALDALSYRKPVLAAENSIIGEVAGDAALLVDIGDVESIAGGLARLASDAELRNDLIRRGDERRNASRWPEIASGILDLLYGLTGG